MAKTCIQCGKKIGLFKKAVDGIYCSLDCQAIAQEEIHKADAVAQVQRAEAQKQAEQDAKEAEALRQAEEAAAQVLRTCPKCGAGWEYAPAGADGVHAGRCSSCAFTTQFKAIENCPSCSGKTMVVDAAGVGSCPRCKYRSG